MDETELWENVSPVANNWVIFQLQGTKSNRDGLGTEIRLLDQYNIMTTTVGYASSSHAGVHFGLGPAETVAEVEILWPGGARQVLQNLAVDQVVEVREPTTGP